MDVSRILFRPRPAATISLGSPLPTISSTLPAPVPRTAVRPAGADRRAACACTRWGLPCPVRHRPGGALLPHRFTLTPSARRGEREGGLFSVALSLAPQRAGGSYPPPCPVVFGLSSSESPRPRSPVHADIVGRVCPHASRDSLESRVTRSPTAAFPDDPLASTGSWFRLLKTAAPRKRPSHRDTSQGRIRGDASNGLRDGRDRPGRSDRADHSGSSRIIPDHPGWIASIRTRRASCRCPMVFR